jgi:hypothetical protein
MALFILFTRALPSVIIIIDGNLSMNSLRAFMSRRIPPFPFFSLKLTPPIEK